MTDSKASKAPERFIKLLQKAMDDHPEKLSLREVARRADISPAYLSYLLSGDRGVPSNEAIAALEMVLDLQAGILFEAAGKPDDRALEFFRKDDAAAIMRALASFPKSRLPEIRRMIEKHGQKKRGSTK